MHLRSRPIPGQEGGGIFFSFFSIKNGQLLVFLRVFHFRFKNLSSLKNFRKHCSTEGFAVCLFAASFDFRLTWNLILYVCFLRLSLIVVLVNLGCLFFFLFVPAVSGTLGKGISGAFGMSLVFEDACSTNLFIW